MEIEGSIKIIKDEQQVSDKFKKREIVITTDETYPQHILIEFNQDKCNLVANRNVGDKVKVSINIRGREWQNPQGETKYFNQIQGWKIELLSQGSAPVAAQPVATPAAPVPAMDDSEELPF